MERGDRTGVVAISSGNHAMAVALAGREAGVPATLVMLENGPPLKRAAVLGYGAEVVWRDVVVDNREDVGDALHDERGLRWIHPFDDPDLIAGHGTVGVEIVEQAAEVGSVPDYVLVPVGGGALAAGIGCALAELAPDTKIIGVEPEIADDLARSLASGQKFEFESQPRTIATSVNHVHVGDLPLSTIRSTLDSVVTVSEDAIGYATWLLWHHAKLVVEPAGALGLAALISGRLELPVGDAGTRHPTVVCVVSGGNVDPVDLSGPFAAARDRELAPLG